MRNFAGEAREILASSLFRRDKARRLAELVRRERNFHWVGLYDVSATEIAATARTGETAPAFPTFPVDKGLNGAAVAQRRPVVVQDVTRDPRYLTTFGPTKAEAIFPVFAENGKIIGTVDVESDRVNAFGPADTAFLESCASLLTPLWRRART